MANVFINHPTPPTPEELDQWEDEANTVYCTIMGMTGRRRMGRETSKDIRSAVKLLRVLAELRKEQALRQPGEPTVPVSELRSLERRWTDEAADPSTWHDPMYPVRMRCELADLFEKYTRG